MDRDIITQLATIFFDLDDDLIIRRCSDVLQKYCPDIEGQSILDAFEIQRPVSLSSFEDLASSAGKMILMVEKNQQFAARGQFVLSSDLGGSLKFVGSPWLYWLTLKRPDIKMKLNDFPAVDPQLDQMVFVSTERQNLEDLVLLNEELTEAKERVEESSQVQSEFFALMSHEMRTPLSGVISALELLNPDKLGTEDLRLFQIARNSADNLRRVVDQVLNHSKLQAGGFSNDPSIFNLSKMLGIIRDLVDARARGQNTHVLINNSAPEWLVADEAKLRQVLINLVGNAVKFTRNGEVSISASHDKRAGRLRIQIADTGEGIPSKLQPRIFDSYYNFESSSGDTFGTGLGLSICQRFVELMEGSIHFESREGEGTTFFVEIPCTHEERPNFEKTDERVRPTYFRGRVLLVEDNQTNQYLAKTLLERRGIDVDVVSNGQEALDTLNGASYDLVFMDISMPVMDGIEAITHIRQNQSKLSLPVVAMTAHVGEEEHLKYKDAGMNSVMIKPIDVAILDDCLAQYCQPANKASEPEISTPVLAQDDTASLIDGVETEKLIQELSWDVFKEIREMFATEAMDKQEDILSAYKSQNPDRLAKSAHSIRSTAATLGCLILADYLKSIELMAREENWHELDALLPGYPRLLERSLDELKKYQPMSS